MSKAILGLVRFSFVNIDKPRVNKDTGAENYGLAALIPKTDTELVGRIKEAIEEAKQEGLSTKFGGKLPKDLKTTIHDGDETDRPENKGMWVLNTTSNSKPQIIVGKDRHPAIMGEVKSGDWGYISVNFAAYNKNGNRGIGAYLNNVFKTKDGESLMGRTTAEDDFKDLKLGDNDFYEVEVDPLTGRPIGGASVLGPSEDEAVPF